MIGVVHANGHMAWLDVEYMGRSMNAQCRMGRNVQGWQGTMGQVSYVQWVTPALTLGVEAGLNSGLTVPTSAFTVKYDKPRETAALTYKSHMQPSSPGEGGMSELTMLYHRQVVPDRLNLATMVTIVPMAMQAAASIGAEFQLHQSTVSTAYSLSSSKITSTLQSKIIPSVMFSASGEVMFGAQSQTGEKSDAYKFGFGLSIG